jgi:hypothetical protein
MTIGIIHAILILDKIRGGINLILTTLLLINQSIAKIDDKVNEISNVVHVGFLK